MHNIYVTVADQLLLRANTRRRVVAFQNIDAAEYIDVADKSGSHGVRIQPGEELIFHETDGDDPSRSFYGTASGAMNLRVYESLRPAPYRTRYDRPARRPGVTRRPGGASSGGAKGGGGGGGASRTK